MLKVTPLISICMLCYNHEKYLAQAIESVLKQTYSNLELIIVDNASTDDSKKIIQHYAGKDSRIQPYFLTDNSYVSHGLNYAIQKSGGQYIALLSADDYFMPEKLEQQLNFSITKNAPVIFSWVNCVNDANTNIEHELMNTFNQKVNTHRELLELFIKSGNILCATTALIKKEVLIDVGLHDERLLQTQDFELWLRIAKKYPIYILCQKLTNYRVRDDGQNLSLMTSKTSHLRSNFEALYYVRHIIDFDNSLISKITNQTSNAHNKYKNLFNYYMKHNNYVYATAILLALYENLQAHFKFPSAKYADFLKIYSQFDLFNTYNLRQAQNIQIFIKEKGANFAEEKSLKQPYILNQNKYEFMLDKFDKIVSLRLDPSELPCKVTNLNASLIDKEGITYPLNYSYTNCIASDMIQNNDTLVFVVNDAQIVFNTANLGSKKFIKFLLNFQVEALTLDEIGMYNSKLLCEYTQKNQNLAEEIQKLNNKNQTLEISIGYQQQKLNNDIMQLQARLTNLTRENQELKLNLSNISNQNQELEIRLVDSSNYTAKLQSEIETLMLRNNTLTNIIQAMSNSNSWKITAPLRYLKRLLKIKM